MTPMPPEERPRTLVPFEVGSFLRAPYGWTNRMRRQEGYPERGERIQVRVGPLVNVVIAFAVYGPIVLGALLGWQGWRGWQGAGLGAVFGLTAQLVVGSIVVLPTFALVQRRRSRGRGPADTTEH